MTEIIVLIICITLLGCVWMIECYDPAVDALDLSKKTKAMQTSLDRLAAEQEGLKEAISECDVFIHRNAPRMTFMIEVHWYDMKNMTKDEMVRRIAEKVEEVYKEKK